MPDLNEDLKWIYVGECHFGSFSRFSLILLRFVWKYFAYQAKILLTLQLL